MSLWKAEVAVSAALTLPSAALTADGLSYAAAGYGLAAYDGTTTYIVYLEVAHDRFLNGPGATSNYRTLAHHDSRLGSAPDPFYSGGSFVVNNAADFQTGSGDNGTAFRTGGVLSITLDDVTGNVSATTPLGTVTPWSGAAGRQLKGIGIGVALVLLVDSTDPPGIPFYPIQTHAVTPDFSQFWQSKDGVHQSGAALSATDPGSWTAWKETVRLHVPPGVSRVMFTQQPTAEEADLRWLPGDAVPSNPTDSYYREFTGVGMGTIPVDMTRSDEHGLLWAIYPVLAKDAIVQRKSHDAGRSWQETPVFSGVGTNNDLPGVGWHEGRLIAVWQRGAGTVLQSVSVDLGGGWSVPTTLSITGTNPRLLVYPGGIFFYFFFSGADLKVRRSHDYGVSFIDAAAVTVAAAAGAQPIGAEVAPDGTLLVGYFVAGAWTQRRSYDLGVSWS